MLGKGLESLIPQGGAQKKASDASVSGGAPESTQASPTPIPSEPEAEPQFVRAFEKARPVTRVARDGDAIFQIETDKIKPNPFQPRRDFNDDALKDLADSISEFGIIQPLVVTKIEKEVPTGTEVEYQLIAGERRLLAARKIGLPRVPVIIRKVDADREHLEIAIIENLQRENLNPIETARAFARLQDEFRLTQREIATQLGKSREVVANSVRLLDLPTHMQDSVAQGEMSESHGRLLLAITDSETREKLFRDLVGNKLTTRELRERVAAARPGAERSRASAQVSPELQVLQERLSTELGAPVEIRKSGDTGRITITFYSGEELHQIVNRLGGALESEGQPGAQA